MAFTMWRGVVGLVRPTRRPGAIEELIRMLPEGIGVLPFTGQFQGRCPGGVQQGHSAI